MHKDPEWYYAVRGRFVWLALWYKGRPILLRRQAECLDATVADSWRRLFNALLRGKNPPSDLPNLGYVIQHLLRSEASHSTPHSTPT